MERMCNEQIRFRCIKMIVNAKNSVDGTNNSWIINIFYNLFALIPDACWWYLKKHKNTRSNERKRKEIFISKIFLNVYIFFHFGCFGSNLWTWASGGFSDFVIWLVAFNLLICIFKYKYQLLYKALIMYTRMTQSLCHMHNSLIHSLN